MSWLSAGRVSRTSKLIPLFSPDIDTKVSQVISLRFGKQSFWEKGKFPGTITNKTTGDVQRLVNPWINQEENVAPFDQRECLHTLDPRARTVTDTES